MVPQIAFDRDTGCPRTRRCLGLGVDMIAGRLPECGVDLRPLRPLRHLVHAVHNTTCTAPFGASGLTRPGRHLSGHLTRKVGAGHADVRNAASGAGSRLMPPARIELAHAV